MHIDGLGPKLELPGLDPGEQEEVGDQKLEPDRVPERYGRELALRRIEVTPLALDQRLDVALDRGERRAQLVGDPGDELSRTWFASIRRSASAASSSCAALPPRSASIRPASERLTRELSQTMVRSVATDAEPIMITTAASDRRRRTVVDEGRRGHNEEPQDQRSGGPAGDEA